MPLLTRISRLLAALLVASWVALLVATKVGWIPSRPSWLAVIAGAAGVALAVVIVGGVRRLIRGPRRGAALAECLVAGGFLVAMGGGLVNWARGYQGFVAVGEKEPVRLAETARLDAFHAGPLANRKELELTLALARLRLEAAGTGGFTPVSRLKILDKKGEEVGLDVSFAKAATYRTIFFRQGAFGFAPRIVLRKGMRPVPVLDTEVPFRTVREGADGIAFTADFEISAERLLVHAALTLEDLNDDMKGHPRLEVEVERIPDPIGGSLGRGKLKPGEFAQLEDGYELGFVGLQRWSEIDFARRPQPLPMFAGIGLAALGLVLWPIAAWRRW
jgi:hypothetical protein